MEASRRRLLPISAILIFFSIAYLIFSTSISFKAPSSTTSSSKHRSFHAPKQNVWAELTADEVDRLLTFLYDTPNELNLTREPTGTGWENDVRIVEVAQPNKSDVVQYLDRSGRPPPRWAKILVNEAAKPQARTAEYMVGPLSKGKPMSIIPMTYCYNSGRNFINRAGVSDMDGALFAMAVAENISDITMDLLGAKVNPMNFLDPDALMLGQRTVYETAESFVVWLTFMRPGGRSLEWSLLPQGIYIKVEGHGREPAGYRAAQWAYNGFLYDSEDDFRTAWQSPDFVKLPRSLPGQWSETENFDASPPGRSLPPPIMVQPHGPRYQIDVSQGYVSYMGFTFYLSSSFWTGLSLYDVRFNDSRIIYSLGLQEALSHYAGSDPVHGGMYWFDAIFGMGASKSELIPGYDCPAYADFINNTYQAGEMTWINMNNMCIFEYTADHPISRHSTPWSSTSSLNTYLVVRTIATVGNYDYMIDFNFYLDGTIEVKYRASGYIMATFYPPFSHPSTSNSSQSPVQNDYGYHIHDSISSSIHTHILAFRADLDIAGESNTFVRTKLEPITRSYPWDEPQYPSRNTMHLSSTPLAIESALDWPANAQEMYVLLNNASVNAWGEKRGYRLMPGTLPGAPTHLAVNASTVLGRSARWAESDLFVLRQHDNELASSTPLSFLSPNDPLIDFAKMLDNESTLQEDLVVYFNLGNHHVPTSHDIPNTLMHISGSGVMFVPFNYFERDASRETVSGVRVDEGMDEDGNVERGVRWFGGHYKEGEGLEPDLNEKRRGRDYGLGHPLYLDPMRAGPLRNRWMLGQD